MGKIILKAVARQVPGTMKFTVRMVPIKVPDTITYAHIVNSEMAPVKRRRKTKMEKRRIRKRYERERGLQRTG